MDVIHLNKDYQFAIEPSGKRVRLVVYQAGVEKVCRLEMEKNLKNFIRSGDELLFKGRLQLKKGRGEIAILVKGNQAGTISNERFTEMLDTVKTPAYL